MEPSASSAGTGGSEDRIALGLPCSVRDVALDCFLADCKPGFEEQLSPFGQEPFAGFLASALAAEVGFGRGFHFEEMAFFGGEPCSN